IPSASCQSMFSRWDFWIGSSFWRVASTGSSNAGKQYPPFFQPMSVPVAPFHWAKMSRLCWPSRIFAGSEWVARTPPIAALFWPCPEDGISSRTSVRTPSRARKYAVGLPTDPAPMTIASNSGCAIVHREEGRDRDLLGEGAMDRGRHRRGLHPQLPEDPQDQLAARLSTARAHSAAEPGLNGVQVPRAGGPHVVGHRLLRDPLAPADDGLRILRRRHTVDVEQRLDLPDADPRDAVGLRHGYLEDHQPTAVERLA